MFSKKSFTGLLLCLLAAPGFAATTIDFEDFGTSNVGNSIIVEGVTFSVTNPTASSSIRFFDSPLVLTTFILSCEVGFAFDCTQQMTVEFGQAVSGVSFDLYSDANNGVAGTVSAFLDGDLVSTMDMIGDGDGVTPNLVSLVSLGMIDSLIIDSSIDPAGLGYDNFSYAVPLPASIVLLLTALIPLARQRRRA